MFVLLIGEWQVCLDEGGILILDHRLPGEPFLIGFLFADSGLAYKITSSAPSYTRDD